MVLLFLILLNLKKIKILKLNNMVTVEHYEGTGITLGTLRKFVADCSELRDNIPVLMSQHSDNKVTPVIDIIGDETDIKIYGYF